MVCTNLCDNPSHSWDILYVRLDWPTNIAINIHTQTEGSCHVFEQCSDKIRKGLLTSLLEPVIVLSHTLLQRLWVTIVWMTEHCVFFFDTLLWLFQTDSTSVPWGKVTAPSTPLSSSSRHLLVSFGFGCREQKDRIWVQLIQEPGASVHAVLFFSGWSLSLHKFTFHLIHSDHWVFEPLNTL